MNSLVSPSVIKSKSIRKHVLTQQGINKILPVMAELIRIRND